jgi:hypothetical protein
MICSSRSSLPRCFPNPGNISITINNFLCPFIPEIFLKLHLPQNRLEFGHNPFPLGNLDLALGKRELLDDRGFVVVTGGGLAVLSGGGSSALADRGLAVLIDHNCLVVTGVGLTVLSDGGSSVLIDHGLVVLDDRGLAVVTGGGSSALTDRRAAVLTDRGLVVLCGGVFAALTGGGLESSRSESSQWQTHPQGKGARPVALVPPNTANRVGPSATRTKCAIPPGVFPCSWHSASSHRIVFTRATPLSAPPIPTTTTIIGPIATARWYIL